ncbi:MAG: hypothetical protein ABSH06_14085, partial [Thermodesulfobacteriota bacterium]
MYKIILPFILLLSLISQSPAFSASNLTPYAPSGWSDKIVVSKTTGTNTDSSPLYTTDTLYVDFAVERLSAYFDPPLNPGYYAYTTDFSIGTLSAGTHTIKIVVDATGAIAETNET